MHRWYRSGMRAISTRGRALGIASVLVLLISLVPTALVLGATHSPSGSSASAHVKPVVRNALKHDTSPQLKTMKPAKSAQAGNQKIIAVPLGNVPHATLNPAAEKGTADVQTSVTTNSMPSFLQNFEGVGNVNGVLPPDTQGAVGPNNYVQMVNLSFAIWNKTGTLLYGPVPNTTLWQNFGGPCETFNGGDPVTMYDETADRWFMSQLAYPGGSQGFHECIAISQTPDPTGAWFRYDFLFSTTTLNDYPKFGIWPDAYYESNNDFLNAQSFTGVTVTAYDRAEMLAGQQASTVSFTLGTQYSSLLPSGWQGGHLGFNPPAGAPDPFLEMCDAASGDCATSRLNMWDFHVDWTTPANSTFGNNLAPSREFDTAAFNSNLCNFSRSCIPQPGTSQGLDALSDRLMYQAYYRNFGTYQAIVLDHSVNVGNNQAGIRWYELTNPGSGWGINQQGTYAPDSDSRWMGSAALDASGDIAIGFSVSSSSTFPSIRVAGRLASDPAGQLAQGETTMMAGTGSQLNFQARWGDYSAMQLDPTDGCTFWYTNEYLVTTSNADWHTRIGSFKFPSCTAGPHGTLSGTVTDASNNQPIAGATVSTTVATSTTDAQGHYALTLPVGTYDETVSAFGYATKTVSGVVITDGGTTTENVALTPSPSVHVTGTVTDGSGQGWPLYARIDINGRPGGPIFTNPATGQYSVSLPQNATYSLTVTADIPGYNVVNDTLTVGSSDLTHNIAITILPTCTAPGYQFQFGTPVLNEPFDGSTIPAGWTVVDNVVPPQGHVWQIGDPENRGNLTGGTGNFADINSDFYGPGNHQDTSLITPTLDLSNQATPILQFHTDYFGFPGQTGDVDLSTDGGVTWTNIWHHASDSVRGPDLETVAIPQAGGKSAVQLRYHFISTFGWWWEVDDVAVMNRMCGPIPGGLVVGHVTDANTGAGINGATVTSGDHSADKGVTKHTADPNVGDGYYWLFSSLTGSHPFTATRSPYQAATQTVNVASSGTTLANFALKVGRLVITPSAISQSQVLGTVTTNTLNIQNNGTAPVNVKLDQRGGAFHILTLQGSPLSLIQLEDNPAQVGFLGNQQGVNGTGQYAGPPANPTWSTIAAYPSGIMDNSADFINGKEYSVGGLDNSFSVLAKGYVYDPSLNTWAAIADMPVAREKPGVAAVNGKLYVTGGWDASGNPIARTDVYDPATNTWSTVASVNPHPAAAPGVAVANGKIYLVGGCQDAFCTTGTTVVSYDPATDTWSTNAAYPHNDAWEGCGGISGKVYCAGGTDGSNTFKNGFVYDPSADSWSPIADMPIDLWASAAGAPNGLFVVSSGVTNGFSTITNQGYSYDPSSDSWTALPNAQFPRYRAGGSCGFYKIGGSSGGFSPTPDSELLSGLDQCGVVKVPWLDDAPTTATLQPGQSVNVTITLSATTADQVFQPGTYTAQLGVEQNTPYQVNPINITMLVTPPHGWGKITGTVTGTDCKGNTTKLRGVFIQANSKTYTFSLKTDANGNYAFWAPAASDPFTLIASLDGWVAQTVGTNVKAQKTVTVNFDLQKLGC